MTKKIFLCCFCCVISLFCFALQTYAADSEWMFFNYSNKVTLYWNTKQIEYDPVRNTARFWKKQVYSNGNVDFWQDEINFTEKTLLNLKRIDEKAVFFNPSAAISLISKPYPIPPETEIERMVNIVGATLGKPPIYGKKPYNWVLVFSSKDMDVYALPDFLDYDSKANACDVWLKYDDKSGSAHILLNTVKYRFFFNDNSKLYLISMGRQREPIQPNSVDEAVYNAVKKLALKKQ